MQSRGCSHLICLISPSLLNQGIARCGKICGFDVARRKVQKWYGYGNAKNCCFYALRVFLIKYFRSTFLALIHLNLLIHRFLLLSLGLYDLFTSTVFSFDVFFSPYQIPYPSLLFIWSFSSHTCSFS